MARAMKDSGIPWIGEIPEEWDINTVFQIFTQVKNKNSDLSETNLLSLSYGKIKRKSIETTEGLLPESFDGYNIIEKDDIVLRLTDLQNDQRSLRVGISGERGIVTSAYVTLRNRSISLPRYLYYYLHSFDISKGFYGMGGGIRQGINWDGLKWIKVLSPSVEEQHHIVSFLDAECARIDAVIEKTRASIEEYKKLKQAVITEAVTKGIRPGRKMKDSGIEWIGEIPEEWGTNKIKYISSEVGDGLHAAPEFSEDGDYYFINGNNLGKKQIKIKENTNSVSKTEYSKYNQPTLCANAILIALNGTYGLVSFYNHEKVMLGKSAGFINLFQIINRDYVRYALLSDYSKKQMDDSLAGTTISNVSLRTVRNLIITWPSNDEQIEISTYLDTKTKEFDDLLARKTEFISELESYKKSIIYEYVTGKKEVRCGK
ncbi:MAG: restriction endonuclease subunit S [Clostridia bacterium]|nr:restriction endonuclease subunit S [Clostridia bacterium]